MLGISLQKPSSNMMVSSGALRTITAAHSHERAMQLITRLARLWTGQYPRPRRHHQAWSVRYCDLRKCSMLLCGGADGFLSHNAESDERTISWYALRALLFQRTQMTYEQIYSLQSYCVHWRKENCPCILKPAFACQIVCMVRPLRTHSTTQLTLLSRFV